jgi:hypothetical protein
MRGTCAGSGSTSGSGLEAPFIVGRNEIIVTSIARAGERGCAKFSWSTRDPSVIGRPELCLSMRAQYTRADTKMSHRSLIDSIGRRSDVSPVKPENVDQ